MPLWIYENPEGRKEITFPFFIDSWTSTIKTFSSIFILLILFILRFIIDKGYIGNRN